MNKKVSIITPSYNTAQFIEETIKSIKVQTYSDWEMIIVDDCSEDNTDKVVQPYLEDKRIRYLKNKENSGAAISRNYALREASGKWIAFLDSDDLWKPDKLEKQVRFMLDNNCAFSYTNYTEMDENGKSIGVRVTGPKRITRLGMFCYCWPGCLTVMYDREQIGLVQIPDIKKNNDYAIWLEVCRRADCLLLDEVLAKYRKRSGSVSRHGIVTMITWHYKLWHEAERKNVITSLFYTGINLLFGFWKKRRYLERKEL